MKKWLEYEVNTVLEWIEYGSIIILSLISVTSIWYWGFNKYKPLWLKMKKTTFW